MSSDALEKDDLPRPGDVVGDKYEVEAILGSGAMGVVFSARHIDLGQRFAIKFLHPQIAKDNAAITRFLREARAASGIQSEHVVRVHDIARTETGTPYLVMEYLTGTDLQRVGRARGPLPISEVIGYVLQACEALAEAHVAGIVHRDLKPGNLFLTHYADGSPLVKVLDFGISKIASAGQVPGMPLDESLTADGQILGSPFYMSPEQLRSSKGVDARTDIWALGSMIYKLLAGRYAFPSEAAAVYIAAITSEPPSPLRPFRPDVPVELERVILRCLELDMSRRFQNVGEFARALQPFASPRAQLSIERILGVILSSEAATEKKAARRSDPQQTAKPASKRSPLAEQERMPMPKLATVPEAPAIVSPGFNQAPSRPPDRATASSFNPASPSSQSNAPQPQQPARGLKSGTVRMPAVTGPGPSPMSSGNPSWPPAQQSGQGMPPGAPPSWHASHQSSPSLPSVQAGAQSWPQQAHQSSPALSPPQVGAQSWPQQAHQSSPALQSPRPATSPQHPPQSPSLPGSAQTGGPPPPSTNAGHSSSHPGGHELAAAATASSSLGPASNQTSTNAPTRTRSSRLLPAAASVLIAAGLAAVAWRLFATKPEPVAPTAPETTTTAPAALPSASAVPAPTAAPTAEVTAAPTTSSAAPTTSSAAPTTSASAPPVASSSVVLKPWPAGPLAGSAPRPPPLGSFRKPPPKVPVEKIEEKVEDHLPEPRPDGPPEPNP
jgi:eukaryotic-like serine/threonine-protein kinase